MACELTVTQVSPAVYQACWEELGTSLKRKAKGWVSDKLPKLRGCMCWAQLGPST